MNNKEKFLHSLHQARLEHTKWLSKVRILSTGTIENELVSQKSFFDSHFATWFQEKASYLLLDDASQSLREIEKLMQHLDSEYVLLYNVCIQNRSKSFLGKAKPLTANEERAAEKYFNAIKIITEKIEDLLTETTKVVQQLPEEKFSFMENVPSQKTDQTNESKPKKSHVGARGAYQS